MSTPPPPRPRPPIRVRASAATDIRAIHAIYGHYVRHTTSTFEVTEPSEAELENRRVQALDQRCAHLVATVDTADGDSVVVGFAYATLYRPARPGYRFTIESSVYVSHEWHHCGIGTQLMLELITQSTDSGFKQMIAVIGGGSANAASVNLHRQLGFARVGELVGVGYKFNQWLDSGIMQRSLQ